MEASIIKEPNAPFEVVDDVDIPVPGADQILVSSIVTAINPVDSYMRAGLLVSSFPIVLGCDASGVVVDVGKDAEASFKIGDRVCGCTRLGEPGYGTFQEYFLMDARLAIPTPRRLSFEEAAGVGVGTETAALGLFDGLKIKVPDPNALPEVKDEWVFILGGAGSVGQYAVQLAKLSGYKVVATCSAKTASLVQNLGADATIDYRKNQDDQLQDLQKITNGNFFGVYDTVAKSIEFASRALKEISTSTKPRIFATTDDWTPKTPNDTFSIYAVVLGLIGKSGEAIARHPSVNDDLASYIPVIAQLVEDEKIQANEIDVFEKRGFEAVADAVALQQKGTSARKVVVVLQDQ